MARLPGWLPWTLAVVGLGSAGYMAVENGRLRSRSEVAEKTVVELRQVAVESAAGSGEAKTGRSRSNPLAVLDAFGRVMNRGGKDDPPPAEGAPPDWEARRAERQQRMRDMLGRAEGESAEEYKARVAPFVTTVLSRPRERLVEKRRQFEEAAGVTPEQKAQLDAAFQSAQAELVGLGNAAVAAGDLTPYKRNTSGILAFVGSTVGTVDAVEQRLGTLLSPEQRAIMDESGFDWLEYLGVSTPWENMDAPPPAPGTGG